MNIRNKFEKDPIELLLGMGGAVQYLKHVSNDETTYLVWVKTKTGTKQLIVPIEAVHSIQSKKPDPVVIQSIKQQLADESSGDEVSAGSPSEVSQTIFGQLKRRIRRVFGRQ